MALNREQIIKALECCAEGDCDNCPCSFGDCYYNLARYALTLVRELTEENERLRAETIDYRNIPYIIAEAKADTVRKFAERVLQLFPSDKKCTTISRITIDQIAQDVLEEK